MTVLLLARHGETDWNREGRFQGHADPSLNETGRQQAETLADSLAEGGVDAVYASDLSRARETAEIVARRLGIPVVSEPGFREVDVGSWSGLTRAEIAERFPGMPRHDGETPAALADRVVAAARRIAAAHPNGCILVVTHGGAIRALERRAKGSSERVMANCEVFRLESDQLD